MDKFKKILSITICVILCIFFIGIWFVAGACWLWNDILEREHLPVEISKIANERKEAGIESEQVAYSITQEEDKIIIAIYSTGDALKTMYIYNLENDVVVSCTAEVHYLSKNSARNNKLDLSKKKRKDNVVTGVVESNDIGKKASELIDEYNLGLSHLVKVDEADLK